ncbi:MAG: BON domain-containing protein [Thermoguttaceae bacterium]|nr:BON domain-containing protein [Thermoguttaceae bacterium]
MRRLFVSTMAMMMILLGAASVRADNQSEANRIAKSLSQAFPQYDIEVAYRDGNVRLRGELQSPRDREAVTNYVRQVARVRSISDQFTFSASAPMGQVSNGAYQQPYAAANGLRPISSVPSSGEIMPVSTLRANEQVYVAQLPAGTEGTYTDSAQLAAPSIVADNSGVQVGGSMQVGSFPNQGYAANYAAVESDQMPMGTIVAGDGAPAVQGDFGARGSYPGAPRGQNIAVGQNGQQPNLPNYSWPTTADYPNYSQVSYPKQYAAGAFPYIGPFYPYPQVPLGWRKVTMEWHDGYWWLDFNDGSTSGPFSPLFRQPNQYR